MDFVEEAEDRCVANYKRHEGWVYFALAEKSGAVKIGYSTRNPKVRREGLQVGCPEPLVLLGATRGDRWLESYVHSKFKLLHRIGEWFEATDDLLWWIQINSGMEYEN
jgi:hypothetical protein